MALADMPYVKAKQMFDGNLRSQKIMHGLACIGTKVKRKLFNKDGQRYKMSYETLKLSNQLCFPLYVCSKEIVRKYNSLLDGLGLTYTQYIAMMVLWEQKQLTVNELGAYLYLDSGTVTPLLKKLEAAGLVIRKRSSNDERSVVITLTDKGVALKEQAALVPLKMGSCINLLPEEMQTLYTLLYKVIGGLCGQP